MWEPPWTGAAGAIAGDSRGCSGTGTSPRCAAVCLGGGAPWKPRVVHPDVETPRETDQDPDADPATTPGEVEQDSERDQAEGGDKPEEGVDD